MLRVGVVELRVLVSEGQTVELECRKQGNSTEKPIVAKWRYRRSAGDSPSRVSTNRRVKLGFRRRRYTVKASNDSGDFSLTIRQVRHNDEGRYTCLIAYQSTEIRRIVHLDVTG